LTGDDLGVVVPRKADRQLNRPQQAAQTDQVPTAKNHYLRMLLPKIPQQLAHEVQQPVPNHWAMLAVKVFKHVASVASRLRRATFRKKLTLKWPSHVLIMVNITARRL
jgi:hypothetical protein